MDARELKGILARNAESVAAYLLPGGKKISNEWVAGSIHGEAGASLKVHLTGRKAGVWADFATSDKGDLLDLAMKVRGCGLREAIDEMMDFMRIEKPKFEGVPRKTYQPPKQPPASGKSSAVVQYLTEQRRLNLDAIKAYKIETIKGQYFSQGSMTSDAFHCPYYKDGQVVHWKRIGITLNEKGKKPQTTSRDTMPVLFGWQAVEQHFPNSRFCVICEGELDALSWFQYGYPALSVPFGGGGGFKQQWTENEYDRLAVYDEIFLALDNDQTGQEGTEEIIKALGEERCRVVKLPFKDANACLQAGVSKEQIDECIKSAQYVGPDELLNAADFAADCEKYIQRKAQPGFFYSLPWSKTHNSIQLQPGQLTVWCGYSGHGKSEILLHTMIYRMLMGERVCIASMEVPPQKMIVDHVLHQLSAMEDPSPAYRQALYEWLSDKLWVFNLTGTAKRDRLLQVMKYARRRFRIDHFVIDSMTKLDISEKEGDEQKAFAEALCDFKNQTGTHIHLVMHSRKTASEDDPPGKMDVRGAAAVTDLADNGFTVFRIKAKERALEGNPEDDAVVEYKKKKLPAGEVRKFPDAMLICWKQRELGEEPTIHLWFDKPSAQFLERPNDKPRRYVPFHSSPVISISEKRKPSVEAPDDEAWEEIG